MATHNYITQLLEQINQHEKTIQQQHNRLATQEKTILNLMQEIQEAHNTTQQLLHHTQNLITHIIKTKPPITINQLQQLDNTIQDTQTLPLYQHP